MPLPQGALESAVTPQHLLGPGAPTCSAPPRGLRSERLNSVRRRRRCSYRRILQKPASEYCSHTQAALIQNSCAHCSNTLISPQNRVLLQSSEKPPSRFPERYCRRATVLWRYGVPLRKPALLFFTYINFLPYKYKKYKIN